MTAENPNMGADQSFEGASTRQGVGFVEALQLAFKNYIKFQGRSSRSAYWWFFLWTILLSNVFSIFAGVLGFVAVEIVGIVISLALFVPSLSVSVRRLHDTDRSGWWLLLIFIPILGWLALIYFYVQPSTPGDNTYGANDEAGKELETISEVFD